jgi:hypothetical protein|tara:strand:+ start:136 stop:429 length:294 start_codon:yes stop_codon:yes gene_type:complete
MVRVAPNIPKRKPRAKRNYRQEYDRYQGKPEQIKKRTSRNAARNSLKKAGVKVAGKDVAHKNGNPRDNRRGNLTTQRPSQNRSFARTRTAGKRNRTA